MSKQELQAAVKMAEANLWSREQREYVRDIYRNHVIPRIREVWASRRRVNG